MQLSVRYIMVDRYDRIHKNTTLFVFREHEVIEAYN